MSASAACGVRHSTSGAMELAVGLSSCPNDTYIFHALLHGLVKAGSLAFRPVIADVESLNERAFRAELPLTKLSFHAFMRLRDRYALLDSGAAFGFGCGPLVVARCAALDLSRARVAVPGRNTTACMLLQAWRPEITQLRPMRFDRILPAVRDGEVDAGVVIHEGRFLFEKYRCCCIADLGAWWESEKGLPIPLGCIVMRNDPEILVHKAIVEAAIRDSLRFAQAHPRASRDFVRRFAGEMDDTVIDAHIKLYVNDYSLSLGRGGLRVVEELEKLLHHAHA